MQESFTCVLPDGEPGWVRANHARTWLARLNRERFRFVERQTTAAAETFFKAYRSGDNPYRRLLFKPRCVDRPSSEWYWLPLWRFENSSAAWAIAEENFVADGGKLTGWEDGA